MPIWLQIKEVISEFMSIEIETTKCYRSLDNVTGRAIFVVPPSTLVSLWFKLFLSQYEHNFSLIDPFKWFVWSTSY